MQVEVCEDDLESVGKSSSRSYKELGQRLEREQQLSVVQRKMEVKAALRDKVKPTRLVRGEEKGAAPVYLWPQERKR